MTFLAEPPVEPRHSTDALGLPCDDRHSARQRRSQFSSPARRASAATPAANPIHRNRTTVAAMASAILITLAGPASGSNAASSDPAYATSANGTTGERRRSAVVVNPPRGSRTSAAWTLNPRGEASIAARGTVPGTTSKPLEQSFLAPHLPEAREGRAHGGVSRS